MKKHIALSGLCLVLTCSSVLLMGCAVAGFSMAGIENRDRPGAPIQVFRLIPADAPAVSSPDAHKSARIPGGKVAEQFRTRPTEGSIGEDPVTSAGPLMLYRPREAALDMMEGARFRQHEPLGWTGFSILMTVNLLEKNIPDPVVEENVADK